MVKIISIYFVSFGIVLGGSLFAGLGAVLIKQSPIVIMKGVALDIKFWAILSAIGGTIDTLKGFEVGFIGGHLSVAVRQILYIISAFAGATMASYILLFLIEGKVRL